MLVEDVTGILEEDKRYLNPYTGKVHSGKAWLRILDRSRYEHIYAKDLKSFVEVKRGKETKTWIKVG
jgi:hypothetical protein